MKMWFKILFFTITGVILFLANANSSFSQQISIDEQEKACCAKNYTTIGMLECTHNAYIMWDKELNKYYGLLMQKLSQKEKEDLKSAQLCWIAFRDKEFININNIRDKLQGTMYINIAESQKCEIVKQRALQLKEFYELFLSK